MKKPKIIRCPYCGGTAILRDASFVYGTHSHGGQVYVCSHYPSCNSYVGVHPGTKIPKGTLANRELRQKRIQAHRIFDQIWQQGILSKPEAYRWVADKFCLTDKQAHIGQFSNYMCDQLIRESADVLKNNHIPFRLRAASEGTEKVDYTVYIWYNVSIKYRRCFYDRTTAEIDAKSIHGNI